MGLTIPTNPHWWSRKPFHAVKLCKLKFIIFNYANSFPIRQRERLCCMPPGLVNDVERESSYMKQGFCSILVVC